MCLRTAVAVVIALAFSGGAAAQEARWIGIDSNFALEMEKQDRTWQDESGPVDPYALFAQAGCRDARLRLWVGDDGVNRLAYAVETAKRAQKAGLKPHLVLFLSDDWADMVKQPVPAAWKDMSAAVKLAAIEAHCEQAALKFVDSGIELDTFGIGNEIDFGICGEFEEEWPRRVSLEYMRENMAADGAHSARGGKGSFTRTT